MSVVTIAALKTYFETGDFPTQAQFEDLIDTLANSSTSIYKRYIARLSQSGTAAPVATVLENTLGGTLVWTRSGVGSYIGTLSGAFPTETKVINFYGIDAGVGTIYDFARTSANTVILGTYDLTGNPFDGAMAKFPIEIRVYP